MTAQPTTRQPAGSRHHPIADLPVLRLVTYGGSFDRSSGHYRDNVIVYAKATG